MTRDITDITDFITILVVLPETSHQTSISNLLHLLQIISAKIATSRVTQVAGRLELKGVADCLVPGRESKI